MQLTNQTKILICVQGLGSERPNDLYDLFQDDLRRFKATSTFTLKFWYFECITSYATNVNQYSKHFHMALQYLQSLLFSTIFLQSKLKYHDFIRI